MKQHTTDTESAAASALAPLRNAVTNPGSSGGIWTDPSVELIMTGDQRQPITIGDTHNFPGPIEAISGKKTAMVIGCITFSTGITTFLAGVVTIAIPVMAEDLGLPESLILWYVL